MKKLLFILLFFVLVTACGHKDKGFMPERLLTEQEMIDVMTDVQIIEADINSRKNQEREQGLPQKDYSKLTKSYYNQLFAHYGITDSLFLQNMRYYTERPADLERIMDSVVQRLTKLSTSSTQPQSNH